MSFSDKIETAYSNRQLPPGDSEAFSKAVETIFGYVTEELIKLVEAGQIARPDIFSGFRSYVRTDIYVRESLQVPANTVVIRNKNTVTVYGHAERKKLFMELKKLANREGIKCFTGSDNIGFEYYLKG